MKKLIIPFVVILLCGLAIINYLYYKAPKDDLMISQKKAYGLFKNDDLHVKLYANRKTAYQTKEAIDSIYIYNKEQTKKLTLEIKDIIKQERYNYLEQSFDCYSYLFTLPSLDEYYYINEAYLYIRLKNGDAKEFLLGSFDYYTESDHLAISALGAKRFDDFPALKSITLAFNEKEVTVKAIYISNDTFNSFNRTLLKEESFEFFLPPQTRRSDELAIKVLYSIDDIDYQLILPYFLYYETNENPLTYGSLNDVVTIN